MKQYKSMLEKDFPHPNPIRRGKGWYICMYIQLYITYTYIYIHVYIPQTYAHMCLCKAWLNIYGYCSTKMSLCNAPCFFLLTYRHLFILYRFTSFSEILFIRMYFIYLSPLSMDIWILPDFWYSYSWCNNILNSEICSLCSDSR